MFSQNFVALNVKHVPLIDPANVDLCFLLESVEDLCNTVASLLDVYSEIAKLQSATLAMSQLSAQAVAEPPATARSQNNPWHKWCHKVSEQSFVRPLVAIAR